MSKDAPERTCLECGSRGVESVGGTVEFFPRRVTDASDLNRGRKVIETRLRCRECGHEFTETREEQL